MSHLALRINYLHANVLSDKSMDERQDYMKEPRGFNSHHPLHFVSTLKNSDFVKPDTLKWAKLLTKLLTRSPVSGVF
jgi:hypothetical protein